MERSSYFIEIEARGRRAMLLRVLRRRFGESIPQDVSQAVQAQGDHDTLEAWLDRALTAATLDELRPTLGLVSGATGSGEQGAASTT